MAAFLFLRMTSPESRITTKSMGAEDFKEDWFKSSVDI